MESVQRQIALSYASPPRRGRRVSRLAVAALVWSVGGCPILWWWIGVCLAQAFHVSDSRAVVLLILAVLISGSVTSIFAVRHVYVRAAQGGPLAWMAVVVSLIWWALMGFTLDCFEGTCP